MPDALFIRGVPFVFSTGYDNHGIPEAYNAFPMIQKPYSQATLLAVLESFMTAGHGA